MRASCSGRKWKLSADNPGNERLRGRTEKLQVPRYYSKQLVELSSGGMASRTFEMIHSNSQRIVNKCKDERYRVHAYQRCRPGSPRMVGFPRIPVHFHMCLNVLFSHFQKLSRDRTLRVKVWPKRPAGTRKRTCWPDLAKMTPTCLWRCTTLWPVVTTHWALRKVRAQINIFALFNHLNSNERLASSIWTKSAIKLQMT